jgi:hypothetical protein
VRDEAIPTGSLGLPRSVHSSSTARMCCITSPRRCAVCVSAESAYTPDSTGANSSAHSTAAVPRRQICAAWRWGAPARAALALRSARSLGALGACAPPRMRRRLRRAFASTHCTIHG